MIVGINANNLAKTPIGESLRLVAEDLAQPAIQFDIHNTLRYRNRIADLF